jgi:gluconokinase
VAGSGKTTIGGLLARNLGWPFYDGDDFHPGANIKKMTKGEPLTDNERAPWLAALAHLIKELDQSDRSAVIACSALKQSYREILIDNAGSVQFVYLKANYNTIMNAWWLDRIILWPTCLPANSNSRAGKGIVVDATRS